jgi:flagellar basal body-associated protein FliL
MTKNTSITIISGLIFIVLISLGVYAYMLYSSTGLFKKSVTETGGIEKTETVKPEPLYGNLAPKEGMPKNIKLAPFPD